MNMYPVKFEIFDSVDELAVVLQQVDECCFEMRVKSWLSPQMWDELKPLVDEAVEAMFADDTGPVFTAVKKIKES